MQYNVLLAIAFVIRFRRVRYRLYEQPNIALPLWHSLCTKEDDNLTFSKTAKPPEQRLDRELLVEGWIAKLSVISNVAMGILVVRGDNAISACVQLGSNLQRKLSPNLVNAVANSFFL